MLQKILCKAHVHTKDLVNHSYPTNSHLLKEKYDRAKGANLPSLQRLVRSGVINNNIAKRIAGSGLSYDHLRLIWENQKEKGLLKVFTSKNSRKKPRVANKRFSSEPVQKLCEWFAK